MLPCLPALVLTITLAPLETLIFQSVQPPASSTSPKPDVLFIAVDDLNDWITPLGGHPQARTKNFERLARMGMCFTNAHCASPACHPSRVAVMTGVHP